MAGNETHLKVRHRRQLSMHGASESPPTSSRLKVTASFSTNPWKKAQSHALSLHPFFYFPNPSFLSVLSNPSSHKNPNRHVHKPPIPRLRPKPSEVHNPQTRSPALAFLRIRISEIATPSDAGGPSIFSAFRGIAFQERPPVGVIRMRWGAQLASRLDQFGRLQELPGWFRSGIEREFAGLSRFQIDAGNCVLGCRCFWAWWVGG